MNLRYGMALVLLALCSLTAVASVSGRENFKLKPGAKGELCLKCHMQLKEKMKMPFVHYPVKSGSCSDCHNPHASSHGTLLAADANKVCFGCHDEILSRNAKSAHKDVEEGNCVKCHDPHAADYKFNLKMTGNDLCFSCHKSLGDAIAGNKFPHSPVKKDCLICHSPHASSENEFLLKNGLVSACVGCHKTDRPFFAKQHMNYPVGGASCTSCHDPHGSSNPGIMLENVHSPVARKMCNQCHLESSSPDAIRTKRKGIDLCRGCHNDALNDMLDKKRVHWPLVDRISCMNCHNPHASEQAGLLKSSMKNLCGACHADTMEKQKKSVTKHEPVEEGRCTGCHQPHSANNVFLFENASVMDICGDCHEWRKHTTHPIGEKIVDPRSSNVDVNCASCHQTHGTGHKHLAHYDTKMDLCVQCHKKFQR